MRWGRARVRRETCWGQTGNEVRWVDLGGAGVATATWRSSKTKEVGLRMWACVESAAQTEGARILQDSCHHLSLSAHPVHFSFNNIWWVPAKCQTLVIAEDTVVNMECKTPALRSLDAGGGEKQHKARK